MINSQQIETLYDAMMFARSPEQARVAGTALVKAVLGEDAGRQPLADALRQCCRILRPARDAKDAARFEDEFVELAIWPNASQKIAA
jgi:hypothetical protein